MFANSFTSFTDSSWVKAKKNCYIYTNLYWFKITKLGCSWRNINGRSLKIFSQNKTSPSAITLERTIYDGHWFNILRLFAYNNNNYYNIFYSTRGVIVGTWFITEFTSDFYPEVCKKYLTLKLFLSAHVFIVASTVLTLFMYPSACVVVIVVAFKTMIKEMDGETLPEDN